MKKLIIAALVGSGLSLTTGASATHVFQERFSSEEECERFLREFKKDGREIRRERGTGTAGSYNQDAKNLRCEEDPSKPGTYRIVG
jgi:hypothetical protein